MERNRKVISLQPEPPLREGQFLNSPVLYRGQALRALAILVIVTCVVTLSGYKPARASTDVDQMAAIAIKSLQVTRVPSKPVAPEIQLAQRDLSSTTGKRSQNRKNKKKVHAL